MAPPVEAADAAIRTATALGAQRAGSADIEFAVRQLVEVAVRALSPGINDPHTAISVLDRLGAALCDVAPLHLSSGVSLREGRLALVVPSIDYDGLTDTMFHMIRQNGTHNPAVLIRMLEVLTAVISCERDPTRMAALERHAGLILDDAERNISTPAESCGYSGAPQSLLRDEGAWAVGGCGFAIRLSGVVQAGVARGPLIAVN